MVSVIVIKIWRSFPFMMISLIAALQTIDTSLYEAARIDGAGRWASFRSVTFPGIQNISIILWILMTIWSVNDFETPFLLTQGGPSNATESLMILAYKDTFARAPLMIESRKNGDAAESYCDEINIRTIEKEGRAVGFAYEMREAAQR